MGRQYFVTATYMGRYKKSQYWCRPVKKPIPKRTPIFDINCLNIAATNNILLVSAGKSTNISIGYCYWLIPIINLKYCNRYFNFHYTRKSEGMLVNLPIYGIATPILWNLNGGSTRRELAHQKEKDVSRGTDRSAVRLARTPKQVPRLAFGSIIVFSWVQQWDLGQSMKECYCM
jgi:hypothetical protein